MDFEQLATEYSNMIHHIIHSLHIYKNHDEFYQIGLIALWEASQRYDEEKGEFPPYLYKYIKGKILTALSKDKKREEAIAYSDDPALLDGACEERLLEIEDLLSHFYRLTDLQKNWVIKRFYYGLSNREIAEMEGVSLRKVRAWGELAMKKLIRNKNS